MPIVGFKDPTALLILQDLYRNIKLAGPKFATISDKKKTGELKDRFLQDFPDEELDRLCKTPEFSLALLLLLSQSLIAFSSTLKGKSSK